MTEETTNLVLEHLRHIDRKVDDVGSDMRQVILRLGSIERHLAGLNNLRGTAEFRDRSHQSPAG